MARPHLTANRLRDLPGPPEIYRDAALVQIERTSEMLASMDTINWRRQSVLPFWTVRDVVGHLFVAGGFFTSSTRAIRGGIFDLAATRKAVRALDLMGPLAIPTLHYSNIVMPRMASALLSETTALRMVREMMDLLAREVKALPHHTLTQSFPYFRWVVPTHVYLAVIAKDFAIHRWEIENVVTAAQLDPDAAAFLPDLLWATALVSSRCRINLVGTVKTVTSRGELTWRLHGGRTIPVTEVEIADVTISGHDDQLALALMGRASRDGLEIRGDEALGRDFLAAFSYRAGPVPFFNP